MIISYLQCSFGDKIDMDFYKNVNVLYSVLLCWEWHLMHGYYIFCHTEPSAAQGHVNTMYIKICKMKINYFICLFCSSYMI